MDVCKNRKGLGYTHPPFIMSTNSVSFIKVIYACLSLCRSHFLVFKLLEIWYTGMFSPRAKNAINSGSDRSDHFSDDFPYSAVFWKVIVCITVRGCKVFHCGPWCRVGYPIKTRCPQRCFYLFFICLKREVFKIRPTVNTIFLIGF